MLGFHALSKRWLTAGPSYPALCSSFPVSSVLPFAISSWFCHFPFDTLLVDRTFLPSCTEEAFSCDGFALNKVRRPGWVSLWSSCGSCYVTWILRAYRSPIVCENPVLKHLIPDRSVTHMVIITAACFAGTHHLCNVLSLLSQKHGHTYLMSLQCSCWCMLNKRSIGHRHKPIYFSSLLPLWHTWW